MTAKDRLTVLARGAAYLVVTGAIVSGVRFWVGNPMTGVLIAAMVVSVAAGRAGIVSEAGGRAARRRALLGGGATMVLVLALVSAAMMIGATLLLLSPTTTALFGVAESFAAAYVAELWLHGMSLHFAQRADVPLRWAFPYAVFAGMAPTLLAGGLEPTSLALAAASGAFFTALWLRGGDAWAPLGAHFAWAWSVESLLAGDLFDLSSGAGRLMLGPGSTAPLAWLATLGFAALTLAVLLNKLTLEPAELPASDPT
jgi:hypothetical protein